MSADAQLASYAAQPTGPQFRAAIAAVIQRFLDDKQRQLASISPELEPLIELARDFTDGGKRLRPAFAYWSYLAAGGADGEPAVLQACAGLELLHVGILAHDDLIDDSDTRRGMPSAHQQFATQHDRRAWRGDPAAFGMSGAIVLGDLLMGWANELVSSAELASDRLTAALSWLDATRTEVNAGQYLDLLAETQSHDPDSAPAALRILEYKTARYTVIRPAQFGAALAGADAALIDGLQRFGSPLGHAFQLRDDVLGIFGSEQLTGKPAGDDLREGKRTLLIAWALDGLELVEARELDDCLGDPELSPGDIAKCRELINASGALSRVEAQIEADYAAALAVLDELDITSTGRIALRELARQCVQREA